MTAASAVADLGIMMLHSFSICFSPLAEVWVWEDLCLDTVDITELEVDSTLSVVVEVGGVVTVVFSVRPAIIYSCIIHLRYLASFYHYYEVNKNVHIIVALKVIFATFLCTISSVNLFNDDTTSIEWYV